MELVCDISFDDSIPRLEITGKDRLTKSVFDLGREGIAITLTDERWGDQ